MEFAEERCLRILTYKPPRIAMSLLASAALIQSLLPDSWLQMQSFPVAGVVIATLGFLLMIRAWWLFRIAATAICPRAETTSLIRHDVYRLTRNPMYLGIVMMLLGAAVVTGGALYFAAAVTFFAIIDHSFCPYEEDKLCSVFGDEYVSYSRTVRRWL